MYDPIEAKHYLFIDGNYFLKSIERSLRDFFEIEDFDQLNFSRISKNYTKVFWYDSLPSKKHHEDEEEYLFKLQKKKMFLDTLRLLDKFHVFEGTSRIRNKRQEQKGVDTLISIHMLRHSFRNNMKQATLFAGDMDFKPLLEALVMEGMYTTLWYDYNSVSKELLNVSDSKRKLKLKEIRLLVTDPFSENKLPEFDFKRYELNANFKFIDQKMINNKQAMTYFNSENNNYYITVGESQNGKGLIGNYIDLDKLVFYIEHELESTFFDK